MWASIFQSFLPEKFQIFQINLRIWEREIVYDIDPFNRLSRSLEHKSAFKTRNYHRHQRYPIIMTQIPCRTHGDQITKKTKSPTDLLTRPYWPIHKNKKNEISNIRPIPNDRRFMCMCVYVIASYFKPQKESQFLCATNDCTKWFPNSNVRTTLNSQFKIPRKIPVMLSLHAHVQRVGCRRHTFGVLKNKGIDSNDKINKRFFTRSQRPISQRVTPMTSFASHIKNSQFHNNDFAHTLSLSRALLFSYIFNFLFTEYSPINFQNEFSISQFFVLVGRSAAAIVRPLEWKSPWSNLDPIRLCKMDDFSLLTTFLDDNFSDERLFSTLASISKRFRCVSIWIRLSSLYQCDFWYGENGVQFLFTTFLTFSLDLIRLNFGLSHGNKNLCLNPGFRHQM